MNTSEELISWRDAGLTLREIEKMTGIQYRTLLNRYKAAGIDYFKYDYRKNSPWDLSEIYNPGSIDGQYVIGLLAADGYVDTYGKVITIWLKEDDVELIHRILNTLKRPNANIIQRKLPSHVSVQCGINIGSKQLVEYLSANYGITRNKSKILPFPSHLKNPLPYLRGFFDGDGYIGDSCTFTCGSTYFANYFLQWIFDNYGYSPYIGMCGLNRDITQIVFRKKHARFIHDLFYYPGLMRKTINYQKYLPK